MKDRRQSVRVDIALEHEQAAKLRISILLDNVDTIVRIQKFLNLIIEGKCLDPKVVQTYPGSGQMIPGLPHRVVATADGNDANPMLLRTRLAARTGCWP